ncbi:oleandomycin glycosyltransferase-like [Panonychus citri]|uniref:oleandomycin glycosyltransferase-like n=1 Tax=Panonychus citri TaxID=50023 RepID=UPI002306EF63|nr:oleandomycin glycosyltransferase-like [Panonychus citri]
MKPKYRILISAVDAFGHINCTLGFGEILAEAGHEVTFAHRIRYKKLADLRGFKFIPLDESIFDELSNQPFLLWTEKNMNKFRDDPIGRYSNWTDEDKEMFASVVDDYKITNKAMEKLINENKDSFDILIGDFVTRYPALYLSPIPYIPIFSMNPLSLYPHGPPMFSGFSVNGDPNESEKYRHVYQSSCARLREKLEIWWKSHDVPKIPGTNWYADVPKYFGFYHYPEELDYHECEPKEPEDKWILVDALIRKPDDESEFIIPESIASLPGKLIYFSLGSLGSVDVDLMRKLISILSKSPNRFIVSKGPRGDEIELANNMWGANYVNQIAIVKLVDLVITHGGNNTFLETIYSGKPLIVIPYFFDQFDNAQRVVDCGIGRRLNPWDLDEKNVLATIEETLNNHEMSKKIEEIAASMRSNKTREKAVKIIEDFIEKIKQS